MNWNQGIAADKGFFEALGEDTEFVDVLLRVSRYDFYFLGEDHPFTPRLAMLESVVKMIAHLLESVPLLREQALSGLISVLSWHERFSSPFLLAARVLVDQEEVDCTSLNICRDVLEGEIYARALPNTYSLGGGALVFETSQPFEEVQPLYQGAKKLKARFHRLVETDEPAEDNLEVVTIRLYATRLDYTVFEAYLGNTNTREYSGGYYGSGIIAMPVTPAEQRVGDNRDHVDTFLHEYGHYLGDRFGFSGFGQLWFNEGLAEFLIFQFGSAVRYAAARETRPDPEELFASDYTYSFEDIYTYTFSELFYHFMHQRRRTALLELMDLVRSDDIFAYGERLETWAEDAQLAADFDSWLDEQVARVDSLPDAPTFTYPLPGSLASDSVEEIEGALQQIDGGLGLRCQSVETETERGFICRGSLPAESGFSGDRGALNEHLNARLDGFMARATEDYGQINNFETMTCYFTNPTGSPPVADLRCDGPLRPEGLARAQVDLRATLLSDRDAKDLLLGQRHAFSAYLDFEAEAASNVTMTWSSSLPIANVNPLPSVPCEVVEETKLGGKLVCGAIYKKEGTPFSAALYFNPLETGSLVFSVAFSSAEPELEPADNVASMELTITRPPHHIATLSGHTSFVKAVAFSPDSTTLASGALDSTVRFWDAETLSPIAVLKEDSGVLAVAFSPTGSTLAAGTEEGIVRLWDVATQTRTASLEGDLPVHSVAFSPDGHSLAAGLEESTVKLWDLETQTSTSFSWYTDRVKSLAFSPDGSRLAAGLSNASGPEHATVQLLDVKTDSDIVVLSGHTEYVKSVAFSSDGTFLASGAADGTVRLWDVNTGTHTATFDHNSVVHSVAFSPVGNILAAALEDNSIWLYDLETGTELFSLIGHLYSPQSLAFSPDGARLASGGSPHMPVLVWKVSQWTIPGPATLQKMEIIADDSQGSGATSRPLSPSGSGGLIRHSEHFT